jgi:NTE family protein
MNHRSWLASAPFTVALGAGFFGFFAHAGVLHALEETGLEPSRIIGVSAGALAGGLWATGMSARAIALRLATLRRLDFWDPGIPLGGLLRGVKFSRLLCDVLDESGVDRIENCRTSFCAVVHDLLRGRPSVLERGSLEVAIRASCAVPLMFRPLWVEGRPLVDGGLSDRCGASAMRNGQRVLVHYLRSRLRFGAVDRSLLGIPRTSLVLEAPDLPKLGPFRLEQGYDAFERARAYTLQWLEQPAVEQA